MPLLLATQEVRSGGLQIETSPGKKLARSHLNKQARCGGDAHNHSCVGGIDRRIKIQGSQRKSVKTYPKKYLK
jgi:translation initiation factor 1 (eIF-1/SUI1)